MLDQNTKRSVFVFRIFPAAHVVAVRAYDAANNVGAGQLVINIK